MKDIKVKTQYTIVHSCFWTSVGVWGWLWRTLIFIVGLLAFILLFCIPYDNRMPIEPVVQNAGDTVSVQPVPHTGDVQILLSWNNEDDLDLICAEPNGSVISYQKKRSATGGCLDVDMNASAPYSQTPIENIYWPEGRAPKGHYEVYVSYYAKRSSAACTKYKVVIKYGELTEQVEGTCCRVKDKVNVFSFDLE